MINNLGKEEKIMKFMNKKDSWVTPMDIGGGAGDTGSHQVYPRHFPERVRERNEFGEDFGSPVRGEKQRVK